MDILGRMRVLEQANLMFGMGDANLALKEAYVMAKERNGEITDEVIEQYKRQQEERMRPILEKFNEVYGRAPEVEAETSPDKLENDAVSKPEPDNGTSTR